MMENYANNLEDIVTERTSQLIEAKRETEELLYKIFPRYCLIWLFVSLTRAVVSFKLPVTSSSQQSEVHFVSYNIAFTQHVLCHADASDNTPQFWGLSVHILTAFDSEAWTKSPPHPAPLPSSLISSWSHWGCHDDVFLPDQLQNNSLRENKSRPKTLTKCPFISVTS